MDTETGQWCQEKMAPNRQPLGIFQDRVSEKTHPMESEQVAKC